MIKHHLILMRFDKPVGIWLLLMPSLTALWLADAQTPPWPLILLFMLGTVLMRALGCVINDLADRHWDGAVPRTAHRPLVVGSLSVKAAWLLLGGLILCAGLCLLLLSLYIQSARCVPWAVCALAVALVYPFVKRFSFYPQAVLGLAFSFGIPLAVIARSGHLGWWTYCLWAGTILWTMAYDTLYAMVDREADAVVGIQSTARAWGQRAPWVITALDLGAVCLWMTALCLCHRSYEIVTPMILMVFVPSVYWSFKTGNGAEYFWFKAFLWNQYVGLTLWLGVVLL